MSVVDDVVQICRKVYAYKLVSAYDGNISARNTSGTILITRSEICKCEMTSEDI